MLCSFCEWFSFCPCYIWWQQWDFKWKNQGRNCQSIGDKTSPTGRETCHEKREFTIRFDQLSQLHIHSALRIKPGSFSASSRENWLAWLRTFKSIVALNKWNQELQCQILPAYLKGLAEQTYYSLPAGQTSTWATVEQALTDHFHPKESHQVQISTL